MYRTLIAITGVVAGSLICASAASAATVSIGLQETGVNGGAISTVATGTGTASYNAAYGTFSSVQVGGSGAPTLGLPTLLDSNTLDAVSSGFSGTLNVFISEQGVTAPTGTIGFLSSFTQNLLTAGWGVTEETFLDSGNGLYAETTALGSTAFTTSDPPTVEQTKSAAAGTDYSLTEEYIISAPGAGNTNSTIDLQATPIPGTLPLFASGLAGFWAWSRKRKVNANLAGPSVA